MSLSKRSQVGLKVLRREGSAAASHDALSRQARESARKRGPKKRHLAAVKAIHTKGHKGLSEAAKKAARARKRAA